MTPDRSNEEPSDLAPFRYVASMAAWNACLKSLQAAPRLAIDLEANSMFAYRERVCLIQISTSEADYIIDPLAADNLTGLGDIIADPIVEKIFHAAEYDLILMRRDYGWHLNNLFDTMWAARILGYPQMGLANLLDQFFNVRTSKRYQKANWCHRPLSAGELAYAQKDTHYLIPLRDRLAAELETGGHAEEATEIFHEQARVRMPDNEFDPNGFWHINGAYDLSPEQQAALQALYLYRDREARRRNAPHFKVISDRTLMELATARPTNLSDLSQVYGMSDGQQQRYGRALLQVLLEARQATPPLLPKRAPRPPDAVLNRFDQLHRWRKGRAQARGVESDVIVGRDALWTIALSNPRTLDDLKALNVLGPWRLKTYGQEILRLI